MEFRDDDLDFEPTLRYAWCCLLGVAGVLDLLATFAPALSAPADPAPPEAGGPGSPGWLHDRSVAISITFSSLCFCDAFLVARRRRRRVLRDRERRRLLHQERSAATWWDTASCVHLKTVALQLLLLPVGFYFFVFRSMTGLLIGDAAINLDATTPDHQPEWQGELLSEHGRSAVLVVIFQHCGLALFGAMSSAMHLKVASLKNTVKRFALGRAVRNPLKFRRQVKTLLARVRYAKYLAPIVGGANKLLGNLRDVRKKARQRRVAQRQKRVKRLFWQEKPVAQQRDHAATVLQSAYRAYRTRRATRALQMMSTDKYAKACLRVQRAFRSRLNVARARLQQKKEELKRLKREAREGGQAARGLSQDKRARMYTLQDELAAEAKRVLNQSMLLRPNTKFAVVWRLLFVLCVTLEIAQKAVKPLLVPGKKGAAPLTVGGIVAQVLAPVRASELPQCWPRTPPSANEGDEAGFPWYCETPFTTVREVYADAVALAFVSAPAHEWPECRTEDEGTGAWARWRGLFSKQAPDRAPPRWYCEGNYARLHSAYRTAVDCLLEKFSLLVGVICFLDVPVTFFVGELRPETGVLVPKPFFARWCLPGLLLQLLVNPQMAAVSLWASALARRAVDHGPVRVYRWTRVVLFPLAFVALNLIIKCIWLPVVAVENSSRNVARSRA